MNKNKSPVISVSGVYKRFGQKQILADVTFTVSRGEIFGILGKNGAGKTVLINTLLGLIKPDAGKIAVFGLDLEKNLQAVRSRVNLATSYQNLQIQASIRDNLTLFAGLYGVKNKQEKITSLLNEFGLTELADKNSKIYHLSSGENTKVMLSKALINDPEILFMDEPTAFLDPFGQEQVTETVKKLSAQKHATILYTSHRLEEINSLCSRVAILKRGRLSYLGGILPKTKLTKYY